jgi:tetratricopeptide (TPR) repeat protein
MPTITIEQAFQMATTQFQTGHLTAAEAMYRKILEAQPVSAEAWVQLGEVCVRLGRRDEGTACYRQAIQLHAQSLCACVDLGNAFMDRGRLPEAIAAFEQALKIEPDRPELHYNLGNVYVRTADLDKAIACYQRALALRPDYQKARSNLGAVYLDQNRLNEALAQFQLQSDSAKRSYDVGVVHSRAGRSEEAIAFFQQAIAERAEYADALWALSSELLRLGRFEEGWRTHARHGQSPHKNISHWKHQAPQWDGSRMNGDMILIYEEQGHGDTIHFLRYLPLVRERAGDCRIVLECPPLLVRLLRQNSDTLGAEVLDGGHPFPLTLPPDRQISFLELPFALRHWAPLPVAAPYLRAGPAACAVWRARLRSAAQLRVGVAWAGNPKHPNDRRRSMPAEKLLPLFNVPGVTFHSLQIRPQGGSPMALLDAGLLDLTASITDFADTAALLTELDLIITVDTAVAHLAGALGRPVWTILPFVADWRWGRAIEDTPWYPTMRLFRQSAPGDWDTVIGHVSEALGKLAAL